MLSKEYEVEGLWSNSIINLKGHASDFVLHFKLGENI